MTGHLSAFVWLKCLYFILCPYSFSEVKFCTISCTYSKRCFVKCWYMCTPTRISLSSRCPFGPEVLVFRRPAPRISVPGNWWWDCCRCRAASIFKSLVQTGSYGIHSFLLCFLYSTWQAGFLHPGHGPDACSFPQLGGVLFHEHSTICLSITCWWMFRLFPSFGCYKW